MSKRHHKHGKHAKPAPMVRVNLEAKYADHPRFYVGYGSNHNVVQMQARCKDAMPVCAGMMPDTLLVFSGVLTVEHVAGESTPVSVWHVSPRDIAALDRYEGYPRLYGKKTTHVTVRGERVECFYYTLNKPYHESPSSPYYYATVAEGYDDWGFDHAPLRAAQERARKAAAARPPERQTCAFCGDHGDERTMTQLGRRTWLCGHCSGYYADESLWPSQTSKNTRS